MTVAKKWVQLLLDCDRPIIVEYNNRNVADVFLFVDLAKREHLAGPEAKLRCTDMHIRFV